MLVAQWIEQPFREGQVAGSSPARPTGGGDHAYPRLRQRLGEGVSLMRCPSCAATTSVVAAAVCDDGSTIRRRRRCSVCDLLFTTLEYATLITVAPWGVRVPFSRWSVITKVRTAAQRHCQVIDSVAHRKRTRGPSLGTSLPRHLAQRRTTEPSELGATSPFSLASASGRG